jgi:alanine-glyoxylate transaminase/serine-glyoxylate transaminase/serine-pyruvate transaminase
MARPTLGHLDPVFVGFMDELKGLLQFAFQTSNPLTMPISGPGSVGMEACFVNLVQPGDTVIVCVNGVFGGRMKENVVRCGATAVVVDDEWGRAVDPTKVEQALKAHPDAKILAFVHAETSTGARSDAEALVRLAHDHDCLAIADTVTSLGGIPVSHAGAVTRELQPSRRRDNPGAKNPGSKLVHGHQSGDGLLGHRPEAFLPPHRTDQRSIWPS